MKQIQNLLFITLITLTFHSQAQTNCDEKEWCWGENEESAKFSYTIVSDAVRLNVVDTLALKSLEWLLNNTPQLNKALYQQGVKVYHKIVADTEDETLKQQYQDRALELYDLRIKYYGEEAKVLAYKGNYAYGYWVKRKKYNELFELYDRILELNQTSTSRASLNYLMVIVKLLYKEGKFTEEDVFDYYQRITNVIEANEDTDGKWTEVKGKIDKIALSGLKIDCEFVREKLAKKITETPQDIKTSKLVRKYIKANECQDDSLYNVASINIFNVQPSVRLGKSIYKSFLLTKDYEHATMWIKKTLEIIHPDSLQEKAEVVYDMAVAKTKQGHKVEARILAIQAIENHQAIQNKAYSLIGNLYMDSQSECPNKDEVKARAIYFAAYDAYEKAGNEQGKSAAKAQFPTIETIFTLGYKEKDPIAVECWIGGTATIMRR